MSLSWVSALPALHLYNSLGRRLERFEPKGASEVLLYTCGPTIYDFAHIGNLRTFVFEDILRRSLKLFGFRVKQVMNLTDVDDKTIRGAIAASKPLREHTEQFALAFFEDIDRLGIERAECYPRATDYIPTMISMVQQLLDQGYAYQGSDGSVYFSIERYSDYGRLSQLSQNNSSMGHSRINHDEYNKELIGDFVLWKAYDPDRDGSIYWPSPWGPGRPGWHIECSAMAKAILGEQIDIHTGGVDNLFPHHENEIAQSECCHHRPFARYWLHAEHLLVDGRKMSKSLGNYLTLRDLLAKSYDPLAVRYLLLQNHYRHSLNFTSEGLKAAARSLERLRDFYQRLQRERVEPGRSEELLEIGFATGHRFLSALADDLNTSAALGAIFEWIPEFHRALDQGRALSQDLEFAKVLLHDFDRVLGVIVPKEEATPAAVEALFDRRQDARARKQWALSDQLRDQIAQAGYLIEDSPEGSRLKKRIDLRVGR